MPFWKKSEPKPEAPPAVKLARLPEPFRSQLLCMYAGEPQPGANGQLHPLDATTRISAEQGMWLYEKCLELKPKQTAEIGLAYGFSTIYFLAAIHQMGSGFHTAIDPLPGRFAIGVGPLQAQKVGMAHAFRFLKERSFPALVELGSSGERFDLIFVDGSHRFDDALVDFTLSAEVCPVNGCIVLDDMWMPPVQRTVSFVRSNRPDFRELKAPIANIAVFERIGPDERKWDHYVDF